MLKSDVPKPTSLKSINKMVKLVLDEHSIEIHEKELCVVCQEIFNIGNKIIITNCKHSFHEECLNPWLKMSNKCPFCRFNFD